MVEAAEATVEAMAEAVSLAESMVEAAEAILVSSSDMLTEKKVGSAMDHQWISNGSAMDQQWITNWISCNPCPVPMDQLDHQFWLS